MRHEYGTRAAEYLAFEVAELGRIAAKRRNSCLKTVQDGVLHRCISSKLLDFQSFNFRGQLSHHLTDKGICGKGGAEIDAAAKGWAEDILGIGAGEFAYVPGGLAKQLILREFHIPEGIHEIHEKLHGRLPVLRIAGMAALTGE